MWRCFPGVSKTHNKNVVKETPQKANARDSKKRRTRRKFSSLKRALTVLEMTMRECVQTKNQMLRCLKK